MINGIYFGLRLGYNQILIYRIVKDIGIKCPECKENNIIERRSRKGKVFYGCAGYPKCKFAVWDRPVSKLCPKCNGIMVVGRKGMIKCNDKECGYEEEE